MKIRVISLLIAFFLPATTFAMDYGNAVEAVEESVTAEASSAVTEATDSEVKAEEAAEEVKEAVDAE